MGLLGGAAAAAVKALQGRATSQPAPAPAPAWTPIPNAQPVVVPPRVERPAVSIADLQEAPAPAPAKKAPAKKAAAPKKPAELAPWVEPVDGECPPTHPVKGKLASKIYHLPGGFNYARTKPDRCYRDAAAAEADGLRPSKR
jgi:hypothetical protein